MENEACSAKNAWFRGLTYAQYPANEIDRRVYLSGPMRGQKDLGFPAFDAARDVLLKQGYDVISPTDIDRACPATDQRVFAARDIAAIDSLDPKRDMVVVLPGWRHSTGTVAEVAYANWIGIRVAVYSQWGAPHGSVTLRDYTAVSLAHIGRLENDLDVMRAGPADTIVASANGTPKVIAGPVIESDPTKAFKDIVEHAKPPAGLKSALALTHTPTLPTDHAERKLIPLATGLLDYFPAALAEVAKLSRVGNEQHNPGSPLHWDRSKSGDEADTMLRHALERGTKDTDGMWHDTKVAWRALANLQKLLEQHGAPVARGAK